MIQKKSFIKLLILTIIFSAFISPILILSNCLAYQITVGEELTYKVKWMHIRLGTVKIQVCDSLRLDNQKVYHAKFFIDSNPLLFFVNMHSYFECYLDENFYPHRYRSEEKVDGKKCDTHYHFNYQDNLIHIKIVEQKDSTKVIEKSIPLNRHVFDGISLIFFIRSNAAIPKQQQLAVIAGGETWQLDLNILGNGKKARISSIDGNSDTYEIEGKAHFTSTAGVTGKFRARFNDDPQNIPLMAEFKVFIGHVRLILESWTNVGLDLKDVAKL